jgi:hypothetical protein
MKKLVSMLACLILLLNIGLLNPLTATAQPLMQFSIPGLSKGDLTAQQQDLLKQLEIEVLPQFDQILTPEQREQFAEKVLEGKSFRKAFKAITLTPQEKIQIANLLKTLPKRDIFATLTPEQKKKFFIGKKEFFMPTAEEITDKIKASIEQKDGVMPDLEAIKEKISDKLTLPNVLPNLNSPE